MKNATIRVVIILATLSIVGIVITQLYWVRRALDLKEGEFNRTVNAALYNVAQKIYEVNETPSPANNPVRQLSTNYFIVMLNSEINAQLLEFLLRTEFEKHNMTVDFEYGIYDCTNERMVYGKYVPLKTQREARTTKNLPEWANKGYYFGVQFPNREAQLINQMGIWSFLSVVLLVVIVFFSYTLFVILKQKRLSEIQRDFINNMTHEFKTPISTIAVSAEVLRSPDIIRQPERLLNYVTIIEKENTRLQQQVERVLQVARLEKGDIGLKKEPVDVHQVIDDAIRNTTLALQTKQGKVVCVLEAMKHTLAVDKLHLTNVLYNLIDNAINYCQQAPLITIQTSDTASGLVIDVRDNGMGISKENQRRVFQKFYRVPTGNRHDVKGFGIGLSYVKTIIEAHGGNVTLQSEPGRGSSFSIFIPS